MPFFHILFSKEMEKYKRCRTILQNGGRCKNKPSKNDPEGLFCHLHQVCFPIIDENNPYQDEKMEIKIKYIDYETFLSSLIEEDVKRYFKK